MPGLAFRLNTSSVLDGLRVRARASVAACNLAAQDIALDLNERTIPALYPGQVARTLVASAELARAGGYIFAVRARQVPDPLPLFQWFEFGTQLHVIAPTAEGGKSALYFFWKNQGYWASFAWVQQQITGRHLLPALIAEARQDAWARWSRALHAAMQDPGAFA